MYGQTTDVQKGWDARAEFVKELVFRLNQVGLANDQNQKQWLETVQDYLDLVCVYFQDDVEKFQDRLDKVNIKIHAKQKMKDEKVVFLTDSELARNKDQIYSELRKIFREMHIKAYNEGAYMPIKGKQDPKRAIAGYHDKK